MSTPLVSVVIPYFNSGDFIGAALAQLGLQTFGDFEVVISDDGSSADEADLARTIAERAGARYVRHPHAGPSAARNRGVAVARGTWIAFLDADDVWAPEKLERQVQAIQNDPELDFVFHHTRTIDETGAVQCENRYTRHLDAPALLHQILCGNIHSFTSSMFISRDAFDRLGGFDEGLRFREDHLLLLRAIQELRWLCLPETLSMRRLHDKGISSGVRNRHPTVALAWTRLFLDAADRSHPNVDIALYLAFECQRLAKHQIILGHSLPALCLCLLSLALDPRQLKAVGLIVAAMIAHFQPSRFDRWNPQLAKLRGKDQASRLLVQRN